MTQRPVRILLMILCLGSLGAGSVVAGGVIFGLPSYTLDVSTTLTQLPVAVGAAFDAIESTLLDLGVPPAEWSEVRTQFDDALAGIESFASTFPAWVPVPLLGGGIELRLPLLIVDGIRFSGGWISDTMVRTVSHWAGVTIPQPLVDFDLAIGESESNVLADLAFSAWALSTEVVKRFDLLLLAFSVGGGVDLIGGEIRPQVSTDVPPELAAGVTAALDALHLDALSWSAFAAHGTIGFEIGPPFLRLYGDVRWTVPLSQREEWWGLRLGPVSALLGFVIRF